MFRKLLATTAIAALMTAGALAQTEQPATDSMQDKPLFSDEQDSMMESDTGFFEANASQILASDLLGMSVYNGATDEAEMVGDINDVVMGPNGEAEAVVIGVGGFLGIGEKEVAVDFAKISWVDHENGRWLIIDSSKQELEGAPAFDRTAYLEGQSAETEQTATADDTTDMMAADPEMEETAEAEQPAAAETEQEPSDMAAAEDQTAEPAMEEETAAAEAEQPAMTEEEQTDMAAAEDEQIDSGETAAISEDGWTPVSGGDLSADDLIGTRVYGADNADLGEIGDVIVTADGQFEAYVIDVGGFLGIGEKPVALDAAELEVLSDAGGNLMIRTGFTQEELEGQSAYSDEGYEENRDEILLR
jgi:sporulation protein YlmC with PRC-barrel domain